MPLLKKGAILGSDTTGACFRVTSGCVGVGGFGEVYRGQLLDEHRDPVSDVAVKVMRDPRSWHGEAYFGGLLEDQERVVRLLDAFQHATGAGAARLVRYFLVFEWIDGGTVEDFLARNQSPVPEDAVRVQTVKLLELLAMLHRRGICHADITPRNVYVRDGDLVLGDLGIAKQGLTDGPMTMAASTPAVFAPPDQLRGAWTPSDDVYQLALIALSALAGEIVVSYDVCGRLLKSVAASDHFKGWIRDGLGPRAQRFVDASEALAALSTTAVESAGPPRSLTSQHVVFTGRLRRRRAEAQTVARKAGAIVQSRVNGATTVVVVGETNPLQIGQKAGTKLFDAHRRMWRGQRIAILDEVAFDRLVRRSGG